MTLKRRLREDSVSVHNMRRSKQSERALSMTEREEILLGVQAGDSDAVIGARIGRHRSTIWREIRANGGRDGYRIVAAQNRADCLARRPRPVWTVARPEVWAEVVTLLRLRWSPEQCARQLRIVHPADPRWWVSHEAIYQAIYVQSKGELRRELTALLRTKRSRRRPQGRAARGASIVDMVNISERPPEVEDRAVPGHWEGDLILGKDGKSAVATLAERTTRYLILVQLDSKHADHVAARLAEQIEHLPESLRRTLTWDQGTEMAAHAAFSVATGVPVYFCDPHSPWQRGTNENTNRLVRDYLPKGTDLSTHSQDDLDAIADELNTRIRETLGWETPAYCLDQLLVASTA